MDNYTKLVVELQSSLESDKILLKNLKDFFNLQGSAWDSKSPYKFFNSLKQRCLVNDGNVHLMITALNAYERHDLKNKWTEYAKQTGLDIISFPENCGTLPLEFNLLKAKTYHLVTDDLLDYLKIYFELCPRDSENVKCTADLFMCLKHQCKLDVDKIAKAFEKYGNDELYDLWSNYGK